MTDLASALAAIAAPKEQGAGIMDDVIFSNGLREAGVQPATIKECVDCYKQENQRDYWIGYFRGKSEHN